MASIEQGSSGNLTPLLNGVNILPYTILGNGLVTVTNAGTAVVLGSSTAISTITIRALSSNMGLIYVGTSSVSSANGFELSPQETVSLDISNLNKIYIDAQNSGEGITYITLT
jgi:hypothetical protein